MKALLAAVTFATALTGVSSAQCEPQWLPGSGVPGVNGGVYAATAWDPDGGGPLPSLLVVGGKFTIAGDIAANYIAAWDGAQWSALGTGMAHGDQLATTVNALVVMPNGDLVAGGTFTSAGGVTVNHIARWNGSSWSALGSGMQGTALDTGVRALAVMPNGDLAAGGKFTSAGGVMPTTNNLARWDGANWSAITQGTNTGTATSIEALAVLPNGNLVAGGNFTSIGGFFRSNIARYDGAGWVAMGSGVNDAVRALAVLSNGDVAAGGAFTTAGGSTANNLAVWNGASWSSMNAGLEGPVESLLTTDDGSLYVGGQFSATVWGSTQNVARWDGASWHTVGARISGLVYALAALPDGNVAVGGTITDIVGDSANNIVLWNGAGWLVPGSGFGDQILTIAVASNGDVIAGGAFSRIGDILARRIARWDGVSWEPLGSGLGVNTFDHVEVVLPLANGDIVAGGQFRMAGAVSTNFIARWDGQQWSPFGIGMSGTLGLQDVNDLLEMPNGDIIAAGGFNTAGGVTAQRIARWDGTSWSPIGSGFNSSVFALALMPNGDIVAGGQFTQSGSATRSRIARWDGVAWRAIGTGITSNATAVYSLAVHPNGDLIAGGNFTNAGGVPCSKIARWDGTSWHALGTGMDAPANRSVQALEVLPDGDVLAGGNFTTAGGLTVNGIGRWNGVAWSAMGSGVGPAPSAPFVNAIRAHPSGEILVGGNFHFAGGNVSAYFARWLDEPTPRVAHQPQSRFVATNQVATLEATPATGYSNVAFQWRRNGVDVANGPGGVSAGGGDVSGASGTLPSPTDGSAAVLTITGAQPSDSGQYTVVFSNTCGDATSDPATLTVTCAADFDADGFVTGADFDLYVQAFEAGELTADFDGDGFVTGADFDLYVVAYETGC